MDKQKTAVKEVIEVLGNRLIMILNEPNQQVKATMIHNFVIDEDIFLAIEKNQIVQAATFGIRQEFYDGTEEVAEQYYSQTFERKNK